MAELDTNEQDSSNDVGNDAGNGAGPFLGAGDARSADGAPVVTSSDVGILLCATRMRMGKDLQRIAEVLHIRYNYLVAIEDGRYEDLPGQAYAIGFVRAYADHLGLGGNEVIRRYKEESAGVKRKASFEFPIPTPDSGVPSGVLLLVAVVFGMVVYGAWYSIAGSDRGAVDLIQEVPNRLIALLDGVGDGESSPVAADEAADVVSPAAVVSPEVVQLYDADRSPILAEETARDADEMQIAAVKEDEVEDTEALGSSRSGDSTSSADVPESPATPVPADDGETLVAEALPQVASAAVSLPITETARPGDGAPKPAANADGEAQPSAPAAESGVEGALSVEVRTAITPNGAPPSRDDSSGDGPEAQGPATAAIDVVELRAKADSWIQLREGDELLLTRLLRKGEVFRVPESGGLTLMTSNAGGLEVLVNGQIMPPLGNEGSVARGVPLDPRQLRAGGG